MTELMREGHVPTRTSTETDVYKRCCHDTYTHTPTGNGAMEMDEETELSPAVLQMLVSRPGEKGQESIMQLKGVC